MKKNDYICGIQSKPFTMKALKFLFLTSLCFMGMTAQAQQNLNWGQGEQVISPEVNPDNTVTFRMVAPQAKRVQITGDFMPSMKMETPNGTYDSPAVAELRKDDKGVWTFKSKVLKPELYMYNFIVDGVKVTDPLNV